MTAKYVKGFPYAQNKIKAAENIGRIEENVLSTACLCAYLDEDAHELGAVLLGIHLRELCLV